MAYTKASTALPTELYISEWSPVLLKDGSTATLIPFNHASTAPEAVINIVHKLLNDEIEQGDTYPQDQPLTREQFVNYYFSYFVAVLVSGEYPNTTPLTEINFEQDFLGCYYIKPNYPGRASHNCNGGFLVSKLARGKGVGSALGETYLKLAPRLGFRYSVFNLVFTTNVASWKIWDNLGFQRIGCIPKAAFLKSYGYTDAYVYGYDFYSAQQEAEQPSPPQEQQQQ